ncbi:MAG: energy-coupling factor transporter transmembrane component T [Peptoniphilaceae bacterium]|nr:energy-coupling factor transporter transmembrane protein EcfT [Peptoniphilaceae bacterium]MDD7383920.1 energy-coupling factor transporter transmembrane component T [Peptoniphilaceae bacterium]MDY3738063.1 energy-coupling factor transporter transmembrane component T [Peptoniphilaceae bacterium]
MKSISIGQYLPYDTFVHRLDPRVKIIFSILFMIEIFFVKTFMMYVPLLLIVAIVIYISKIPIKGIISSMKPIVILLLITSVINVITTPGEILFSIWKIDFTKEGIYKALFMMLRIVFIITVTSILTYTTSPMELTDGLEKLMSPLTKFGFPAGELAMMISIALRFIPTLFKETEKIKMAQMARGADFESGNIIERAKNMIPLLVPLFINSFKRADELSVAMEARLYRGGEKRTRLNELKLTNADLTILILSILAFIIIIIVRYI